MRLKTQIKTEEEYACLLAELAPPAVVEKFKQFCNEGKRIHAIQILREYKLLDKP